MRTINLELAAEKRAWMRSNRIELEHPRQVEMWLFLAWLSRQPGGLQPFCAEFIEKHGVVDRGLADFDPAELNDEPGLAVNKLSEQGQVKAAFRGGFRGNWFGTRPDQTTWQGKGGYKGFERAESEWLASHDSCEPWRQLGMVLVEWCEVPASGKQFLAKCPAFLEFLCGYMDRHAARELEKTADTATRRKVAEELELSEFNGSPVAMVGDSRLGKTSALATFANAWPGRWVLVTCDESNRERGHIQAHARALGLEFKTTGAVHGLKARVEDVLRELRPGLLYDEAHFLIPSDYSKGAPPARLNWVRQKVIDMGIPCVFLSTPQNWKVTLDEYARRTGYNMEQIHGRLESPVQLDGETSREDLEKIAAIVLPGLSDRDHRAAVLLSLQKLCPTQTLRTMAERARFLAHKQGRTSATIADVFSVAAEHFGIEVPKAPAAPEANRRGSISAPLQPVSRGDASPLLSPGRVTFPALGDGVLAPA